MVSAWLELPFARLAGVCDGVEALALRGATIERQAFLSLRLDVMYAIGAQLPRAYATAYPQLAKGLSRR